MHPDDIRELFSALGPISLRRMFGGQGIYRDEVMFALEAGGILYLKVDAQTVDRFRAEGSEPFTYEPKHGRTVQMSYWRLPDTALDDPDEAGTFARLALEAASRARTAKPKRPKRASTER